jgi:hypothetical protein
MAGMLMVWDKCKQQHNRRSFLKEAMWNKRIHVKERKVKDIEMGQMQKSADITETLA